MKRTQEQIIQRIGEVEMRDFFGFERGDLLQYLDWHNAKQFLQMQREPSVTSACDIEPRAQIERYMPFAWDKANNRRGISVSRSMSHMSAWLWLDGHDELSDECADYSFYGKPNLVKVCELYGIEWRNMDDDEWVNSEDDAPLTAEEALKTVK